MMLTEAGWKDQLKRDCLEYIKKKGKDNVSADELMDHFQPIIRGTSSAFLVSFSQSIWFLLYVHSSDTYLCVLRKHPSGDSGGAHSEDARVSFKVDSPLCTV